MLQLFHRCLPSLLEIPHVSVVSKIDYENGTLVAEREIEGGTKEVYSVKKPAMIAANKGLNKPRFASLPGIMKAKKKPIVTVTMDELGVSGDSHEGEIHQLCIAERKTTLQNARR